MSRCLKYENEQSDWHPGPLTWPGYEYPYLGSYDSTTDDTKDSFVPVVYFYCKVFNLTDEKDRQYYQWVKDRIVNGWFIQYHYEVVKTDPDIHIYLEWGQPYLIKRKKRFLEGDEYALPPRDVKLFSII